MKTLQLKIICSKIDLTGERASDVTKIHSEKIHLSRDRSMVRSNTKIMVGISCDLFDLMEDMDDGF